MTGEKDVSGTVLREGESPDDAAVSESAELKVDEATSVGGYLRAAREAKGLSVAEVAKMLKLSARQIESLEADDWQRLPCTTIIRGFVRNYARLLDINVEPLMGELDRARLPGAPELEVPVGTPVRMRDGQRADRRDFLRFGAGFSVLVLALGAYFFVPQDWLRSSIETFKAAAQSKSEVDESAGRKSEERAANGATADTLGVPSLAPVVLGESQSSQPSQPSPGAPAPSAPPAAIEVPPVGTAAEKVAEKALSTASVLRFAFSKPSWVEVRDKSGQIVFSQLSPGGTQKEVEGVPPFVVVIGNAGHVTLTYKGRDVDLSKRSKDDVARLTLD